MNDDDINIAKRHRFGGEPVRSVPGDAWIILAAFALLCGIAAWFAHTGFGQLIAWAAK